MAIQEIVARIEQRLRVVRLSAAKASMRAGLSADAIRNLQRAARDHPERGASTNTISRLAPILGTTASWLLEGDGPESADPPESGLIYAGDGAPMQLMPPLPKIRTALKLVLTAELDDGRIVEILLPLS